MPFSEFRTPGLYGDGMLKADLSKLQKQLADKYGAEAVMMINDMPTRPPISSGSLALDFAIGVGGLPTDRVIEVSGREGCGKTSLGLLSMKSFLKAQPTRGALILDTEHKLSVSWVEQLIGADLMHRVLLVWPDHMEQATDIYLQALESGNICFVLLDSIGGSPSMRVTEKSAEIGNMGGNSLAVTRFAQLASIYSAKHNCLTFCVNQVRDDMSGYNQHKTPGGQGIKHACVLRIKLRINPKGKIEEKINGEVLTIGYQIMAQVIKNQLGAPGRTASWHFFNVPTEQYGFGIDTMDEIVRLSILTQAIEQKGGWYHHAGFPDGKLNGLKAVLDFVKSTSEELRAKLTKEIMERLKTGELAAEVAPMTDPDEDPDVPLRENVFTKATK